MSTGNTRYGNNALQNNHTINGNSSGFGICALRDSTAQNNTAVGAYSGTLTTTGESNVSLGTNSLLKNTTGSYNTALGTAAMCFNISGNNNTSVGSNALENNTANENTAIGAGALFTNTLGYSNTAIGFEALNLNTTGTGNVAVGIGSLLNNTTADLNTAVGSGSLRQNTGDKNTAVGAGALELNISGTANVAMGVHALQHNTVSNNTAIGYYSLQANTTGTYNTAVGYQSLYSNTTHKDNTAVGYYSLKANTGGENNTAVGSNTLLSNASGSYNIAIGAYSLRDNNGSYNVAIGDASLLQNTIGAYNIGVGAGTLGYNTSGQKNTAIGTAALEYNTAGQYNTAVGFEALQNTLGSGTGNNNTGLGYLAGKNLTTGSNNTFLGTNTDVSINTISNSTAIGHGAITNANNQIMMGTSSEQVVIPGSAVLTNPSPSYTATSIVPKSYIDSFVSGLKPTEACKCATTGPITLSGGQTIDTVVLTGGERVLVKNQGGTPSDISNGIYIVNGSGAWTRATDCDTGDNVTGQLCFIESGDVNDLTAFSQIASPGIVGTDALQYTVFYTTNFSLGNGLDVSGNTLNVKDSLSGFLTFVGINGGSNTAYSIDTGATTSSDILVNSVRVGQGSFQNNTCTAVGYRALTTNTGEYNTAIGTQALKSNTIGIRNTAAGGEALIVNTEGSYNTGFGFRALHSTTTGNRNVSLGSQCLDQNTIGSDNIAIGYLAISNNLTGNSNVAIGRNVLQATTGVNISGNVAVGVFSGNNASLTSNYNTLIGYSAGSQLTSGGTNICIGNLSQVPVPTSSNQIAIGTSSETMYIQGGHSWKIGAIINTNTTLSTPLSQFYIIQCTTNATIKLPVISQSLPGAHISFKRYATSSSDAVGRITFQQTDAANVIIAYNSSVKSTSVYLETTQYQCSFICDGFIWLQYNTQ